MGYLSNLIGSLLKKAVIVSKSQLNAHTYHIQLESDIFKRADYVPGYFLRVFVGKNKDLAFSDNLRSYSVWRLDQVLGTLDMAVCLHADGPGTAWAKECRVGDEVSFSWKKTNFILDDTADDYLFVGDLSALGHLYEIHRNLSIGKEVHSLIYGADNKAYFDDIDGKSPFRFYQFPVNGDTQVMSIIPELTSRLTSNAIAYIGGESKVCVSANNYLRRELGWDTRRIKTKPFWNPLKKGLE